MGNDEHHPDAPTKPSNMPEGTRGQGSQEGNEAEVLRMSRAIEKGPGEVDDEKCQLEILNESPDEPRVKPREHTAIQGEPGSKTSETKQNGSVTLENTDTEFNNKIAWARREAQAKVENAKT